jgi:hypothetical protein
MKNYQQKIKENEDLQEKLKKEEEENKIKEE